MKFEVLRKQRIIFKLKKYRLCQDLVLI